MKEYLIWLAKLMTLAVVFLVVVSMFLGIIVAAGSSVGKTGTIALTDKKNVAVVKLEAMILDSEEIVKKLYKQAENDDIKAIVLRINSPGGAVAPSQDINTAVADIKKIKPVVVSMGAVAASGGLYASLNASKVYAQPGTMTGSIGVVLQVPNLTDVAEKVGFKMITVKAGALKDVGNQFRMMTPEERAFLTDLADETHAEFKDAVSKGRNIDIASVNKFADGRVILGSQAKVLGLVDELGDLYAAAGAALELAGAPLAEGEVPNLVYSDDKYKELKELLSMSSVLNRWFGTEQSMRLMYLMQ